MPFANALRLRIPGELLSQSRVRTRFARYSDDPSDPGVFQSNSSVLSVNGVLFPKGPTLNKKLPYKRPSPTSFHASKHQI